MNHEIVFPLLQLLYSGQCQSRGSCTSIGVTPQACFKMNFVSKQQYNKVVPTSCVRPSPLTPLCVILVSQWEYSHGIIELWFTRGKQKELYMFIQTDTQILHPPGLADLQWSYFASVRTSDAISKRLQLDHKIWMELSWQVYITWPAVANRRRMQVWHRKEITTVELTGNAVLFMKESSFFQESPVHQIHCDKEGLGGCHIGRKG